MSQNVSVPIFTSLFFMEHSTARWKLMQCSLHCLFIHGTIYGSMEADRMFSLLLVYPWNNLRLDGSWQNVLSISPCVIRFCRILPELAYRILLEWIQSEFCIQDLTRVYSASRILLECLYLNIWWLLFIVFEYMVAAFHCIW